MTPTIHDVARLAEVSIKTVSNVMNDYPHIRPATRQRVLDAIATKTIAVTVSERYPLADAAKAHTDLQGRKTVGSVVLVP